MSASPLTSSAGSRLRRARAIRPQLVDAIAENYSMLAGIVDALCLDLCRLRIAQILGDEDQLNSVGPAVSPAQVEELAQWRTSSAFGPRERACLEFAEQFLYSAESVTDEQVEELARYFAPEEIWALTNAIAVTERFGRLAAFFETAGAKEVN